ncbi:MAG: hypothetical protein NUV68_03780 [Caldiserica bacterium]|jgi:hypothetical protein|nr:hypothetical protein [Caldisericota bacterium]MDH7562337.1 hypothetical protein [Caldisericota bacterium]
MGDIRASLRWRGFKVVGANSLESVILPPLKEYWEEFYQLLRDYYFRRILADLVQLKRVGEGELALLSDRWSEEALGKYLPIYQRLGLVEKNEEGLLFFKSSPDNFGPTFEWFLAQVLHREFLAEALWSVRLEGLSGGGDFDVLALLGERLFYLEGKSSPPNNVPYAEIENFLQREEELACDCALMVIDTTLRIERNILDNMVYAIRQRFKAEKERVYSLVESLNGNIYFINPKIFLMNTKRDLVGNLERAFNFLFSRTAPRIMP